MGNPTQYAIDPAVFAELNRLLVVNAIEVAPQFGAAAGNAAETTSAPTIALVNV